MRSCVFVVLMGLTAVVGCRREGQVVERDGPAPEPAELARKVRERGERAAEMEAARKSVRDRWEVVQRMEDGEARWSSIAAVAWDALELDPELAKEVYESLPEGSEEVTRLTEYLAMRSAESDPENAMEWAGTISNENERVAAFGRIALVIANDDPKAAIALCETRMVAGQVRDRTVVEVLQRWAPKEARAAAEWLSQESQGAVRMAGWGEIFRVWEAGEAGRWVEQADADLRKELTVAMARQLRTCPPEERRIREQAWSEDLRKEVRAMLGQGD